MYVEDVVRIGFAGNASSGFLVSYDKDIAKDAKGDDGDADAPMAGESYNTEFAATVADVAKLVEQILTGAKPKNAAKSFSDAFKEASSGE